VPELVQGALRTHLMLVCVGERIVGAPHGIWVSDFTSSDFTSDFTPSKGAGAGLSLASFDRDIHSTTRNVTENSYGSEAIANKWSLLGM